MPSASVSPQLRSVAVVLAGGTGQRVGSEIPKQLLKVAGKPIIEHTIQVFDDAAEIDEIIVLMTPAFVGEVERIVDQGGYRKVSRVLGGGATRTETTRLAIAAVTELTERAGEAECDVLLHDAVRPFVEHRIIAECVAALRTHEAVEVAIASSDTIVTVDEHSGLVTGVPRRDLLRRVQTPQCFRLSTIRRAYELAARDPDFVAGTVPATDDCSVVLRYLPDVPIYVVTGSEHNMKVTHPVDIRIAEAIFQLRRQHRPGAASPS